MSRRLVVRVEPLGVVSRGRRLTVYTLVAVFAVVALILPILASGSLRVVAEYGRVWSPSFISTTVFEVARYATAMLWTGLAGVVAFRSRVWNIGLEGYMIVGAIATAAAGFAGLGWLAPFAAFAAGVLWSLPVAAAMFWGLNEVIASMMMYYISLYLLQFVVYKVWPSPYGEFPMTPDIGVAQPVVAGIPLMLYMGVVAAILLYLFYKRSVLGLVLRLVGESDKATLIAGYSPHVARLVSLMVSSGLAGLAGFHIASVLRHLSMGYASLGYGFAGITIAFLAVLNPLLVVPAALLMGLVYHFANFASDALPGGYAAYFYYAQGVILLSVLAANSLPRYRIIVRVENRG